MFINLLKHRGHRDNDVRELIWQIYMSMGITTSSKLMPYWFDGYALWGHPPIEEDSITNELFPVENEEELDFESDRGWGIGIPSNLRDKV